MIDRRQAQSWRAVRLARDELRRDAELRMTPEESLGVVKLCLFLMAFVAVCWWLS